MTDSTEMNSIQSIIASHTASLEEATARHSNNQMRELLHKLADEYDFDADAAAEKFLVEVPPATTTKITKKNDKKKKKKKKDKDPSQPKRAKNPFMLYSAAMRSSFKDDNPDAKPTEIVKMLGAAWKELSEKEQEPYQMEAAKDKERYNTEMKAWNEAKSSDQEDD